MGKEKERKRKEGKNASSAVHSPSHRGLDGPGAMKTLKGIPMNRGEPLLEFVVESS